MGFKCGIVGLPNVGKSTLFNALTQTAAAQAANYPFCTIEPNVGDVAVPDPRLETLAEIAASKEIVPTRLTFVDIAGLVRGASKGEGLGNQFLANIRECDAIAHVVRCFEDGDVTHVEGKIDPVSDIETIETELMLADLESLERRIVALEKKAKGGDKEAKEIHELAARALAELREGRPARAAETARGRAQAVQFARAPLVEAGALCLQRRGGLGGDGATPFPSGSRRAPAKRARRRWSCPPRSRARSRCCREKSRRIIWRLSVSRSRGSTASSAPATSLLHLVTFFTAGPKEARAWTVELGARAPQAAGVIHTDFEKGFIRAETIAYEDYVAGKGEAGAREAGKFRLEGKDYVVRDGDVMHFRFAN